MKKTFIKAIAALVCVCCVSVGWTQTKEDNFALLGVELGSFGWNFEMVNGEVVWKVGEGDFACGWNFIGVDLSEYSTIRIKLKKNEIKDLGVVCWGRDFSCEYGFKQVKSNVFEVNLKGNGALYQNNTGKLDLSDGVAVCLRKYAPDEKITSAKKTIVQSVELIKSDGTEVDYSYLNVLGKRFGTDSYNAIVNGNEITWKKGEQDFHAGWDLIGVDLSEYSRVRIELETDEMKDLEIGLWDKDWKLHNFRKVGPNVLEANLNGEGAAWKNDDAPPLNPSEGMRITLRKWQNKKLSSNKKTVVKSVKLIKDANTKRKEFELLGAAFGSASWNAYVSDNAEICWEKAKEGQAGCGWDLNGFNLTPYADKKLRIELESTDVPLSMHLARDRDGKFYANIERIAPNVYEVYFTGKYAEWKKIPNDDLTKGLRIALMNKATTKGTEKTVVKSVSLVDAVEPPMPKKYTLADVNFGTSRTGGAYVENNNKIIWTEKKWNFCGWDLEGIDLTETPVVSIELESTDVPVKITVVQSNSDDGRQYWFNFKDTTSHCIQIDLSKKEGWNPVKKSKVMTESKSEKSAFDISKGAVIYITPETNPYKPNQTTVVRKAELLKEFTK